MTSLRLITATALAATGLVAVGATTESAQAASSRDLTLSYSTVMRNETFQASGRLATSSTRPVRLQYRSHRDSGSWTTKATVTSDPVGRFAFDVSTSKSRYYRYYAPSSGGESRIVGNVRKVTVVSQTASAYIAPNPVFYSSCKAGVDTSVEAVVTVLPARLKRTVRFTTPNGAVATGLSDGHGHVNIPFAITKPEGTYSITVKADPFNGSAAKSASSSSISVVKTFGQVC